ncbi:MAG: restriction endonuclease subunit S [bacterium]|nr:restriction endonuclease subunit S [bacterium]
MKTKAVIENGFKETEIGLIPEDWEVVNVDKYIQFERGTEPGSENYNKDKKGVRFLRVVDISGSRDDKTYTTSKKLKLCKKKDILITFDGSPGIVKQGLEGAYSSGIRKVVIINKDLFSDYVYYVLQTIYVQRTIEKYTTGVTIKHSSKAILHIKIPFFSIQEQQKIAFVLSKIQQAIEQQDRIIETTRELKKSLMNKLFTEGLHGEEQKETDIGLMPKSWDVRKINEFAKIKYGKQKPKIIGQIPVVGSSRIYAWCEKPLINFPTLIVGRKGNAGAVHLFLEPCWPSDTTFYLEWKSEMVTPKFLYYYMSINQLSGEHAKTTIPSLQRQDLENYRFPFPNISEQLDIIKAIDKIDKKLSQAESKKQTFQALFRTMLNQLMTGKIRVKIRVRDLDVEVN